MSLLSAVGTIAIASILVLTIGPAGATSPATAVTCSPHCIEHVVVIPLENSNLTNVLSKGAYLDYLWTHYGSAPSYYAVCHPSVANYFSMTNGRSLQCGTDNYTTHSDKNIADELGKKGLSWMAYEESMPAPCTTANVGEYVVRHDPFVWYDDIVNNTPLCDRHVVNSSSFNSSVARGKLPDYSFYTPNLYDDGHTPGSVTDASKWLGRFLAPMLNHTGRYTSSDEQNMINHTAFIIVYDESGNSDTSGFSAGGTTIDGGHVYFSVVSPYTLGTTYRANATHYNLESTVEWLFNTTSDGGFDGTTAFPAMTSLFSFSSNGY